MSMAQLGSYLGPGILTHGAGDIGTRSGEQVDLRFYAGVSAIYDNGIQPISVNSQGNLIQVNGLYGVEANVGAYGVHRWKQAQLGLDYRGNFRHYSSNSYYDGSDHELTLGYTYQKSRRLYFDFQGVAGSFSYGLGTVPGSVLGLPTSLVDQPTTLLFDNRTYFAEGSARVTYLLSSKTSISLGGEGFLVDRQSKSLVGTNGYGAHATIQHRLSRTTTIGAEYTRQHFQYPHLFGQADMNSYQALIATQFGRHWTFSLQAGAFQTEVAGLQQVALDPEIAAIFGVSSVTQTFYRNIWSPSGAVSLSRQFHRSVLTFGYSRTVLPGNGVYLTSLGDNAVASYSYTGIRKVSLTVSGGESNLDSVGQVLTNYRQFNAGAGGTYAITRPIHLLARYDLRHQDIDFGGYKPTSYRVTIGLQFSPGNIPLSLW
jgi:hypothetical protein